MLSIDTNILLHAFNEDSPRHQVAYAWLLSIQDADDVAILEFILAEFYGLLRNHAGKAKFGFRRLYDLRSALTMMAQGVTEFATVNVKDFEGLGFRRVWSPIERIT